MGALGNDYRVDNRFMPVFFFELRFGCCNEVIIKPVFDEVDGIL